MVILAATCGGLGKVGTQLGALICASLQWDSGTTLPLFFEWTTHTHGVFMYVILEVAPSHSRKIDSFFDVSDAVTFGCTVILLVLAAVGSARYHLPTLLL